MRDLLRATVGQGGRQPTEYVGLALNKNLFARAFGRFLGESRFP